MENQRASRDFAPGERRPQPWRAFRPKRVLWRPLVFIEWVCEWVAFFLQRWALLNVLELLGRLSLLVAAVTYLGNAGERRKEKEFAAWQVVQLAQTQHANAGRNAALQDLARDGANMRKLELNGVDLAGLNVEGALLSESEFSQSDLRGANLARTKLHKAVLQGADFQEASLAGAFLGQAHAAGARFIFTEFEGATLKEADFSGATFANVDLRGVDAEKAVFRGAELSDVQLDGASLAGSNWSDVRLNSVTVCGADLRDVVGLAWQHVQAMVGDEATRLPVGMERPSNWTSAGCAAASAEMGGRRWRRRNFLW
jgi:uncharacterized protein YjbI with pentapeptide repeats